jgi:hypothetical protein
MSAPTIGSEADRYLARVRAALADLPEEERNDLLDELSAHLADLTAEEDLDGKALTERLGSPEEYAAELRASAGLAAGQPGRPAPAGQLRETIGRGRAALESSPGYQRLRGFAPELRPGWWVLRGYCVAVVGASVFGTQFSGVLPSDEAQAVVFLGFACLVAYASVWIGRRTPGLGVWARRAILAGGVLAALITLAVLSHPVDGYSSESATAAGGLSDATDLRVYDQNGQLLRHVQVFDQQGNPVDLGYCGDYHWMRADGTTATNVYPRADDPTDTYCDISDQPPVAEQLPAVVPVPSPPDGVATRATVTPSAVATPTSSVSASPAPTATAPASALPSSATPTPSPRGKAGCSGGLWPPRTASASESTPTSSGRGARSREPELVAGDLGACHLDQVDVEDGRQLDQIEQHVRQLVPDVGRRLGVGHHPGGLLRGEPLEERGQLADLTGERHREVLRGMERLPVTGLGEGRGRRRERGQAWIGTHGRRVRVMRRPLLQASKRSPRSEERRGRGRRGIRSRAPGPATDRLCLRGVPRSGPPGCWARRAW